MDATEGKVSRRMNRQTFAGICLMAVAATAQTLDTQAHTPMLSPGMTSFGLVLLWAAVGAIFRQLYEASTAQPLSRRIGAAGLSVFAAGTLWLLLREWLDADKPLLLLGITAVASYTGTACLNILGAWLTNKLKKWFPPNGHGGTL